MSKYDYTKLRYVDVRRLQYQGEIALHLRDPLELSPNYAIIPEAAGYILAHCNGQRTIDEICRTVQGQTGLRLDKSDVEGLLGQLDAMFILDNANAASAMAQAKADFRAASQRDPASAGWSYAAEPDKFKAELQAYLDQCEAIDEIDSGAGIFSPHIDYGRGGLVYARVWQRAAKLAREAEYVIVLGTDHSSMLPAQITPTRQSYATPLGLLPTDQAAVSALVDVLGEENAFAEELNHRKEWSIELVINWLHFMRAGQPLPIVPILCGSFHQFLRQTQSPVQNKTLSQVLTALKESTAGRNTLIIASGDLAHLGPYFDTEPIHPANFEQMQVDDNRMISPLAQGDADAFFEVIRGNRGWRNVCGTAPFYLALQLMDQVQGELTSYERCSVPEYDTSFVSVCGMVFA